MRSAPGASATTAIEVAGAVGGGSTGAASGGPSLVGGGVTHPARAWADGVGVGAARARGGSSPTIALGWMLRSWLRLPDPSSWRVRMCHGAARDFACTVTQATGRQVPEARLGEVAAPREEDGGPASR